MTLWAKLQTAPGITVAFGLVFWAMAWYIDFWSHIEKYGVLEGGHVHGGDSLVRINFPMTGFPLIVFGVAHLMGTDTLSKRGGLPLFFASLLMMVDGLAHAFAFDDHLGDPLSAAFFALLAPAQIAAGVAMPFIARRFDRLLVLSMVGLLALYVVSRTVTLAALGWPEAVEGLDLFSKLLEVGFVLLVVVGVRAGADAPGPSPAQVPARTPGDDPSLARAPSAPAGDPSAQQAQP